MIPSDAEDCPQCGWRTAHGSQVIVTREEAETIAAVRAAREIVENKQQLAQQKKMKPNRTESPSASPMDSPNSDVKENGTRTDWLSKNKSVVFSSAGGIIVLLCILVYALLPPSMSSLLADYKDQIENRELDRFEVMGGLQNVRIDKDENSLTHPYNASCECKAEGVFPLSSTDGRKGGDLPARIKVRFVHTYPVEGGRYSEHGHDWESVETFITIEGLDLYLVPELSSTDKAVFEALKGKTIRWDGPHVMIWGLLMDMQTGFSENIFVLPY